MSRLREAFEERYRSQRGFEGGTDPRISDAEIAAFAFRKAGQRLRGVLRRLPRSYVGPRVTLHGRRRLHLGAGTVLAADVVIDALSSDGVHLDDAVTVDRRAIIRATGSIRRIGVGVRIGRRSAVGVDCFIHGGGGVTIGRDVLLGPGVRIFSENHDFALRGVPIIEQGETPAPVEIGDDVWIGAGATVLAGARVGTGAIIAAGAVVRGDVEPYSIVAGVPARVVGHRGDAEEVTASARPPAPA
jgi:acetyltransferase-like isoleucine patch superfamily enzyme